jgi:hypothetical protein
MLNNRIEPGSVQQVLRSSRLLLRKLKTEATMTRRVQIAIDDLPSATGSFFRAGFDTVKDFIEDTVLDTVETDDTNVIRLRQWVAEASVEKQVSRESEQQRTQNMSVMMNMQDPESLFSAIGTFHEVAYHAWEMHLKETPIDMETMPSTDNMIAVQYALKLARGVAKRSKTYAKAHKKWPKVDNSLNPSTAEIRRMLELLPVGSDPDTRAQWAALVREPTNPVVIEVRKIIESKKLAAHPGLCAFMRVLEAEDEQEAWLGAQRAWGELSMMLSDMKAAVILESLTQIMEAYKVRAVSSNELLSFVKSTTQRFRRLVQRALDWASDQRLLDTMLTLTTPSSQQDEPENQGSSRREAARVFNFELVQIEAQVRQKEALDSLAIELDHYMSTPQTIRTVKHEVLAGISFSGLQQAIRQYAQLAMDLRGVENDDTNLLAVLVCAHKAMLGRVSDEGIQTVLDKRLRAELELLDGLPDVEAMRRACDALEGSEAQHSVAAQSVCVLGMLEQQTALFAMLRSKHSAITRGLLSETCCTVSADEPVTPRLSVGHDPCDAAFSAMDINSDGTVTIDEVVSYLFSTPQHKWPVGLRNLNPFMRKSISVMMERMDSDHDGVLTRSEFEQWWDEAVIG